MVFKNTDCLFVDVSVFTTLLYTCVLIVYRLCGCECILQLFRIHVLIVCG